MRLTEEQRHDIGQSVYYFRQQYPDTCTHEYMLLEHIETIEHDLEDANNAIRVINDKLNHDAQHIYKLQREAESHTGTVCELRYSLEQRDERINMLEAELSTLRSKLVEHEARGFSVEVRQHDWTEGFAAILSKDGDVFYNGPACVTLNLGSILCAVAKDAIPAGDVPYVVAESIMHEVIHALESWAKVEFNEDRVEALIEQYTRSLIEKEDSK